MLTIIQSVIGMSNYLLHLNRSAFPSPTKFDPDRWIPSSSISDEQAKLRDGCFAPFSRGTRQCVGMHLAQAELYLMIGSLFRTFDDLRAPDITDEDMNELEDYFGPFKKDNARRLIVVGGA